MRLCVTIPVLNEEKRLGDTLRRLCPFLSEHISPSWEIVIADNGSTDQTLPIARSLAHDHPNVRVVHLDQKGRGRALKRAWLEADADVLS